jgi:hypothetical protein
VGQGGIKQIDTVGMQFGHQYQGGESVRSTEEEHWTVSHSFNMRARNKENKLVDAEITFLIFHKGQSPPASAEPVKEEVNLLETPLPFRLN